MLKATALITTAITLLISTEADAKRNVSATVAHQCPGHVQGVYFYRGMTRKWQRKMNVSPSRSNFNASLIRSCTYTVWVARHWQNRASRWHDKYIKQVKSRPVDIKTYTERNHPCLARIIEHENKAYDPTLDYGGGHGNVYEPYGIPQANPGYKMRSAGPDWATNPFTQLRWMINYAISRFGSECAALAHRLANGWY